MNEFEKKYYEAERFWTKGVLEDDDNSKRIAATTAMVPADATSLADIGCGNGVFGNYLKTKRPDLKIISIDRSETALAYVETEKSLGDILNIPLDNESYDCVTCLQVLEHIPVSAYSKALSELARVSKKYLLISVPYNEDLRKNATECPACGSVFNADLHLRSYSDEAMKALFESYGFRLINSTNLVESKKFVGLGWYYSIRRAFNPQPKIFRSPICPICGYEAASAKPQAEGGGQANGQAPSGALGFLKRVWPTQKVPGYWVIALYQKVSK
jgi:SAM-dependent methyltransferase